jgi:MFS family permease
MRMQAPLDWLNFFLADVKGGLGPFLAIYRLSTQRWDPGRIGLVMMVAGVATVVARAPFGALIDSTRRKRGLLVIAAVAVAVGAVAISLFPNFWFIAAAQVVIGSAEAVFPAAIGAISLGIVGPGLFTRRVGRNEAFNHAGNVFTAIVAGLAGWLLSPCAMLWLIAVLAGASILAAFTVDARSIDHRIARGFDTARDEQPSSLKVIFQCKPLLSFTAAITLFHFANAAMLPVLGEKLAQRNHGTETLFMAACIIVAQFVMIPTAILVGFKADTWGRRPIFLLGFAVLPIRGVLYTLTQDPYALVSIQVLDGIGAGIFGALFFIVLADLTRGTGHYNLAQGAASACWGLGAALSNSVAGLIADAAGYSATFLFLAVCAVAAFGLFWAAVPETGGTTVDDACPVSPAPAAIG